MVWMNLQSSAANWSMRVMNDHLVIIDEFSLCLYNSEVTY